MPAIAFASYDLLAAGLDKTAADAVLSVLDSNFTALSLAEVRELLHAVADFIPGRQPGLRRVLGGENLGDEWGEISLVYVPVRSRTRPTVGYRLNENTFVLEVIR